MSKNHNHQKNLRSKFDAEGVLPLIRHLITLRDKIGHKPPLNP